MNELQNIFTLITGADEFVKFGSVNALIEYFENAPDKSTEKLIEAMKNFSETIKICRTNTLEDDLKNLVEQIKIFRESRGGNLKSQLFAKIIDTIESGYGKLVKGERSRIEIIRWCLEKGFWQQAMTLCTEWLPEEIVNRKIFAPKNSSVIESVKSDVLSYGGSWKHGFITHWSGKIKNQDSAKVQSFGKNLRRQLLDFSEIDLEPMFLTENYGALKNFLTEYKDGRKFFLLYQSNNLKLKILAEKIPMIYSAWEIIYNKKIVKDCQQKSFGFFLKDVIYSEILSLLTKISTKDLMDFFKISEEEIVSQEEISDRTERSKWENRAEQYISMLDNGYIETIFDREKTLEFLKEFYDIRNERNYINHAIDNERKEIFEMRKMIENYLDKIEKI